MLVIKVEIWPLGDESRAEEIGRAHVVNTGTGTREVGNYIVYAGPPEAPRDAQGLCGHVHGHERDKGFWPLLRDAFNTLFPRDENV